MKSTDVNANDATIAIGDMATAAEIQAFIEGDERKTVLAAANQRIADLKEEVTAAPVVDLRAFERPYATVMIPKPNDKNDAKTVTVDITGTLADGSNYGYKRVFRKGMKEHNVPANVIKSLNDLIITDYVNVERADKTGNDLVAEQRPRFTVSVVEQYDKKKTEEEIKQELGIK